MDYNTFMEIYEVKLDKLVYGGDALGRLPDGRAVFVPFGLAGELVRVTLVEEKRGHARGEIVEVLQASPLRIKGRCPHFGVCGGCHYQHLQYNDQLLAKSSILRDQLERIAGIADPPILDMVASPFEWNYRNTIQFSLDAQGKLGFQRAGSNAHVPIRECHLPEDGINQLWQSLDIGAESGIERLEIRQGMEGDALILIQAEQSPELSLDLPVSIVFHGAQGEFVLAGNDHILMELNGRTFKVSAGSFFQVNSLQAGAMVRYLQSILPLSKTATMVDLYCGVGLFSAFFAERVGRLIGIELSPAASQDFAINLDEFDDVELYEGAAEIILPALEVQADVIIVDPPRAGLAREALDAVLKMSPTKLVYISCDPATLARDAKRLIGGGYQLISILPFDLFPQTYHIESISLFER